MAALLNVNNENLYLATSSVLKFHRLQGRMQTLDFHSDQRINEVAEPYSDALHYP